MSKISILLISTFLSTCAAFAQHKLLSDLVNEKRFPELELALQKESKHLNKNEQNFFQALIYNAYGNSTLSNQLLSKLNKSNLAMLKDDSIASLFCKTRYDNYIKLGDYKNAYETGLYFQQKYTKFFDEDEKSAQEEALKIWKQCRNVPMQGISKSADTKLSLKRDLARLWNIDVQVNGSSHPFVFDSGAGISTITESYAEKLKMNFIEGEGVEIKSGITGKGTMVRLAWAPELRMGNISVRNSLWLVFPDSALTFAGGAYKINGIIGFPIIKELEEFSISKDSIFVPMKVSVAKASHNMILDVLKPIIYLKYKGEDLPFTFDTGANGTDFSDVFYTKYKTELEKVAEEKDVERGGAGGVKTMKGIEVPEISLSCFDKNIKLEKPFISKEELSTAGDEYYGNIGQDVIRQFKKMTISFTNAYISFE